MGVNLFLLFQLQVIPLVVIIAATMTGVVGYSTYAALTRPDVRWVDVEHTLPHWPSNIANKNVSTSKHLVIEF